MPEMERAVERRPRSPSALMYFVHLEGVSSVDLGFGDVVVFVFEDSILTEFSVGVCAEKGRVVLFLILYVGQLSLGIE